MDVTLLVYQTLWASVNWAFCVLRHRPTIVNIRLWGSLYMPIINLTWLHTDLCLLINVLSNLFIICANSTTICSLMVKRWMVKWHLFENFDSDELLKSSYLSAIISSIHRNNIHTQIFYKAVLIKINNSLLCLQNIIL